MCGIVGCCVFQNSSFEITKEYLIKMRDTMIHRGPDGYGHWISNDRKIGLGHRRLSIIDLSTSASQPMTNNNSSLQIVFNGEIYNHQEIREELKATGKYKWITSHSDTEVVLHSFEEWGISCLNRFRGMFAIGIWDISKQELWLIRDRIGIKPLYYSIHNNRIIFASEIKALLEDPGQERKINEEGLFNFLSFLTVPSPNTLFDGINKLPSGSYLKVDRTGSVKLVKYWDVLDNISFTHSLTEKELAKRLLNELRTSINYRKVSDVPVGVFLSGGVDSTTNVALFSEGENKPVKTFSIGYDKNYSSYKNELFFAKLVSEKYNSNYFEKLLSLNDLTTFLPEMIRLQDEPIADPVCVPIYFVSKLAKENGVTVCQLGEGADELFIGYPYWQRVLKIYKYDSYAVPRLFKRIISSAFEIFGFSNHGYFEYLRRSNLNQPIFWGGAEAFTHIQKMNLLSTRMKEKYKGYSSFEAIRSIWDSFQEKSKTKHPLDWMTYLDLNLRLPELLLMRVDKMSMGVSLEGRVPFLDHKFVEFSMSIDPTLKLKNNVLKWVLKEAVKSVIPEEIINRPKQGFAAPMVEWYEGLLGEYTSKVLKDFCMQTDLFNWKEVEKLLNSPFKSNSWPLLNLALWWQHYIKSDNVI